MTAPASPAPGSRSTPSGYLLAALLLIVLAPPALLGWVAGAGVLRSGWVSRRRLSAAGAVTGALALVLIGPARAAGGLLAAVVALGGVLPATLTAGAVLEALSAILVRGVGLAAITFPAGVLAATVPPGPEPVVTPEWTAAARRRRLRVEARDRRHAERLAQSPRVTASDALAVALDPTPGLPGWRRGRLVVPPAGQLGLTTLLVGAPGSGKTTASERLAYLAARERRALCVIDGKGTDGLDEAIAAAVLAAWPDARIAAFPQQPVDLWRASPQQLANRLVAAWQFSDEAEYYEQAAMLGLRLALTAPGPPVRSTAELVTRLDPGWLERAWQGHQGSLALIRGSMKGRLGDVALRASNLAASLGPRWDGDWWLDDVDVAIFTLPTLENVKDSDAAMRVLIAAYAQHIAGRGREARRPSMLLFDEFGSLAGGRPLAINIVERARSSGAGVLLSAQSAAGLGPPDDRERLIAASSAVVLFRSPMPQELAALAGSERTPEGAWSFDGVDPEPGRVTVTERHRARLDQDQVRAAGVGEARIIAGGRVEAVRILQTNIDANTRSQARELVAGIARPRLPDAASGDPDPKRGPAGAVDEREVPPPVQPRQGASPAPRRPSGGLDPSGRSSVRRRRPPQVGAESPPDDRTPEEVVPEP